jgi:hypothetical protein
MNRESAMRTRESVSVTVARKTTPRTSLGGVPRINLSGRSLSLNLVVDHFKDHSTRPHGKSSIPSFASLLPLFKIQILKHKNTVLRSPSDELLRCTMTEIFGSTSSPALQPFEGPNYAMRVLTHCLELSKLTLKSFDCLRCAFVLDFSIQAAYEKLVTICICSYNRISLVKVDSDRMNSFDFRKFNRVSNVAYKPVTEILDNDAVDLKSVTEIFFKGIRNRIAEMFSAFHCGNAQESILGEIGISAPLTDKEGGIRAMPLERMIQRMSVLSGRSVSSGSKPNAGASKLNANGSFDTFVDIPMQIKSFQRFALVPCSLRNAIADLGKAIERLNERFVAFDNYLQSPLSKHQGVSIPLPRYILNALVEVK